MANKKISELTTRTPGLSDLMLVGDPSSGYSFKCTVTALATIIETDIADGYVTLGTAQTISGAKTFSNNLTLTSVSNAGVDTDKFLVLSGSNVVNFRTGAEVLSDIGAQAALTNPITGTGTSGQVSYFNGTNSITSSPTFAFTPTSQLLVNNSVTASGAIARGINATPSLTAAANNDVLVGLDINPTFTNGAFTGIGNYGLRVQNGDVVFSNQFGVYITGVNKGLWGNLTRTIGLFYNSNGDILLRTNNIDSRFSVLNNGNILIGTNTDAGFRLDVNGTARVVNTLQVGSNGVAAGRIELSRAAASNAGFLYMSGNAMVIENASTNIELRPGSLTSVFAVVTTTGNTILSSTGALTDNASALLTMNSTTKGFLQPRMTTAQRDAISSPATGLSVYNTTTNTNDFYNGTSWVSQGSASGTSGQVAYFSGTNALTSSATFAFTPTSQLLVNNSITAASAIARGVNVTSSLTAAANNDVLVGLDINPTFTNGAFTGVSNIGIRYAQGLTVFSNGQAYLGNSSGYHIRTKDGSGNNAINAYNAASANDILYLQNVSTGNLITVTGGGKLLVGTSTDAGFKLDVNGTARVQGNITQTGVNTSSLGYIRNDGTLGLVSNPPSASFIGILIGSVSNGGHTAIFTKGNNPGSTAIRVTDQNIGASVNHFIVDYAGSSGFGLPNGTTTVAASAQVEIVSTTKGFLPPRMTTAQRDAISTPATGLSVYNTSTNTNDYYNGSAWLNVGQVLVPANNTTGFSISGSSLTGSNAQSLVSLSQTWNTTGNPTAIKLDVTNTASGNNSYLLDLQVGGIPQFTVFKGGEIKTSSPAGGVAQTWKLGSVQAVTPTSPNRTIEVEVNGTTYYLHAKTTND